jgi:hypothetical protein
MLAVLPLLPMGLANEGRPSLVPVGRQIEGAGGSQHGTHPVLWLPQPIPAGDLM